MVIIIIITISKLNVTLYLIFLIIKIRNLILHHFIILTNNQKIKPKHFVKSRRPFKINLLKIHNYS